MPSPNIGPIPSSAMGQGGWNTNYSLNLRQIGILAGDERGPAGQESYSGTPTTTPIATDAYGYAFEVPIRNIRQTHPLYDGDTWADYYRFFAGGNELNRFVTRYLVKRAFEHDDVYSRRCMLASYKNYPGEIIGWYTQALFRSEPSITGVPGADIDSPAQEVVLSPVLAILAAIKKTARDAMLTATNAMRAASGLGLGPVPQRPEPADIIENNTQPPNSKDQADIKYWNKFQTNCDGAGMTLTNFVKQAFTDVMTFQSVHVQVDVPSAAQLDAAPKTRADDTAAGLDEPYLVLRPPTQMLSWDVDAMGNYNWCIFQIKNERRQGIDNAMWDEVETYLVLQRTSYAVYKWINSPQSTAPQYATLVESGLHRLAQYQQVPVVTIVVPRALWLLDRMFSVAREHYNMSNALSFMLEQACYPQPVLKTDGPAPNMIKSETSILKIKTTDDFDYVSPSTDAYKAMQDQCTMLKDELYRLSYLVTQAQTGEAANIGQSGESKRRDMSTTTDILAGMADPIKNGLIQILRMVFLMRSGLIVEPSITGMDSFEISSNDQLLTEVDGALKLIPPKLSPSFAAHMLKRLGSRFMQDAAPRESATVMAEIDRVRTDPDALEELQAFEDSQPGVSQINTAGGRTGDVPEAPNQGAKPIAPPKSDGG